MNIVIAAGGTAGHINPGISIANTIKKYYPDANITFIGTEYGLESKIVPNAGFDIKFIHSKGLSKSPVKLLKSVVANSQGIIEAKKILSELKPKVVIGMGGYVCAPVLFVAKKILHIPVFIHESNSIAGKTNKFIGNFADGIAVGFEKTKSDFRSKFVFVTGNPVNHAFFNIVKSSDSYNTVLIFGGSQGAKNINNVVVKMINEQKLKYKIIYATGDKNYLDVKESIINTNNNDITILPYINNMPDMFSKVSLVVARAGALTISELSAANMPAILVPLPTAAENHQEHNARAFEEIGNCKVILEKELNDRVLNENICKMLSKIKVSQNKNIVKNADEKIFDMIRPFLEK